jgi:CDP-diacylglycerol--glycerol-3-phosphate 3-phosphatidyltransferase
MPSIYDLKPRFQGLLRPLLHRLARWGLRPNAITLLALLGSCGVGGTMVLATQYPVVLLLFPVWLFVRMALNALDGMMARELHMATPLGAVLNELGDVLADLALYLPFAFVYTPARWYVVAFALGALLTEFCGVLGQALTGHRRYEGPMGKSDRAFVVSALAVLTFLVPAAVRLWPWVFGVVALLTVATCGQRLGKTLQEVQVHSQ